MTSRTTIRTALTFLTFAALVLPACAQGGEGYDEEASKARIVEYFQTFFPQLQQVEIEAVNRVPDSPFLQVNISFINRGRKQGQPIYMTEDGKYVLLGQVWDLTKDPKQVQWDQKKQGSEGRMAKLDLSRSPFRGNPDADVVVVEFSDYQCPYCSRAYANLENQMLESYGDRVKFVFKHLPLEQLHPWAKKASIAAACAQQQSQDAFWKMHSLLFENQRQIKADNLRKKVEEFGGQAGVDVGALMECFDNEATAELVEADMQEASGMGITSTPTFLVNGALVSGAIPLEEMAGYIDQALKDSKVEKDQ